jgi:hypothetical protein
MSYANYPCSAQKVTEKFVGQQCPELLDELKVALDEADIDFDMFCESMQQSDWDRTPADEDEVEKVCEAYEKLQKCFEQMTGLTLYVVFSVDEEEADRGCEVTGGIWCVGGVYELTEAGKKWRENIEDVNWTVGG